MRSPNDLEIVKKDRDIVCENEPSILFFQKPAQARKCGKYEIWANLLLASTFLAADIHPSAVVSGIKERRPRRNS